MNPIEIYNRTKTLSDACIKVALLMPNNHAMAPYVKVELIRHSSDLCICTRSLKSEQVSSVFVERLNKAVDASNGCGYWLQMVIDQALLDQQVILPLLHEADNMSSLFLSALKRGRNKTE
ncbi:MAG: hypothetical protein ACI8ZN_000262 [Bacteroidia bacterium]|jgi:hypothetical protein